MKIIFFPMFAILLFSCLYSEESIIQINDPDNRLFHYIQKENLDITYFQERSHIDILASEETLEYLELNGYNFSILTSESDSRRNLEGYRSYDEISTELENLNANYSDITELTSLGISHCHLYYEDGNDNYSEYQHEIWCLKVSDNPELNEDEPNIFFASEIHAREPISMEVVMYQINYLLENYGSDEDVANWINNTQIWFIPLINPDGYKVCYEQLHTYHRKNMRDNDDDGEPDYSTTDGVDLNRNFGYVWGDNGSSNSYSSSTYHGPYAWSEPETVYLRDLLTDHKFYAGITYHSSGEYVLYPLGHLPGACSYDHEIMGQLAQEMALTIPKINSEGHYLPLQAVDFGYTCQGTMGDWGYAAERIFSYTIELATTYIPPADQIEQISQDNLQAALIMLDRINKSTVTGIIHDQLGEPLIADIFVDEIDYAENMTAVEPVRSDSTFGRYYRLLLPGSYSMSFQKVGFVTQNIDNVIVTDDGVTELNIVLEYLLGDIDQNGVLDILDLTQLITYIFDSSELSESEFIIADLNNDADIDVLDVVLLVEEILGG